MKKDTFWVAGDKNHQYPLRLHCIHQAVRLAEQLPNGIVLISTGPKPHECSIAYVRGEGQVLGNLN